MKKTLLASALFGITLSAGQAQTIAAWNFENSSVAVNNSPVTSTGTGTAGSVGMNLYATPNVGATTDDVLAGASADTGGNGVANLSHIWRIRGQNGGNGAANGWSSLAPVGTQGAQFFASTAAATSGSINVSFDWYTTTQGEAKLQLDYTTDGGTTWQNLAIAAAGADAGLSVLTNTTSTNTVNGSYVSAGAQDWFTGLTATISDPSALGDSGFGIEMVNAATGADNTSTAGTALNNTSGNWRFDNVTVSQVVPEPGTYALLLVGIALLVGFQIRQNRA